MVASRKYIKFLFEFAVRGHPKQDGKYEFQDWLPVRSLVRPFKYFIGNVNYQVMNGQLSHFFFGKYAGSQKGLPFQVLNSIEQCQQSRATDILTKKSSQFDSK